MVKIIITKTALQIKLDSFEFLKIPSIYAVSQYVYTSMVFNRFLVVVWVLPLPVLVHRTKEVGRISENYDEERALSILYQQYDIPFCGRHK